jgi:zinc protease
MSTRLLSFAFCAGLALLVPAAASAADVKSVDMGKGVEVWFQEDHTLPIIAMTVALPAGAGYDPAGKAGLATFAAALLDEGAGRYSSEAYQAALSDRGIRLSARADRDWTTITLVTLKENAKDAFNLLGVALSKPHFDNAAIARVRAQILGSLQFDRESPSTMAARAFFERFFHNHPYGHPIQGYTKSMSAITRNDIVKFARTHWVRSGMHIAVSGDVETATLKTLLGSAFHALPQKAPAAIPAAHHVGAPGTQVLPMPVPQPNIVFGLPSLSRKDKDFIPLYVANYILGAGGFSSRLTSEVREKRGLTYDISTSVNTLSHAGYFAGTVATKAGSVHETIKVIRDTIADFGAHGATQKELDDAKTYLTGSFPLAFTSNTGIAAQLNAFQDAGLPISYLKKRNGLINAVTLDDIRRVAKRVFASPKLTIVIAGNAKEPRPPMRPLPGPDKPTAPPKPVKTAPLEAGKKPAPPKAPTATHPASPAPAKAVPKH